MRVGDREREKEKKKREREQGKEERSKVHAGRTERERKRRKERKRDGRSISQLIFIAAAMPSRLIRFICPASGFLTRGAYAFLCNALTCSSYIIASLALEFPPIHRLAPHPPG